jgi:hypothetical protein
MERSNIPQNRERSDAVGGTSRRSNLLLSAAS